MSRPGRSTKCSRSILLPGVVSSFLPSFSKVTPNDRGIQCICGVRVVWYSSYVHSVAFHIILALSKGTGSGRQQIQPGRGLRAAVNFKPGPRQNWNSKATGSRSSTQRLSYALYASVLVGHDTGVLFFRGVRAVGAIAPTGTTKAKRRYRDHLWTFAVYRSPVDV
jgi:hypothetical protein